MIREVTTEPTMKSATRRAINTINRRFYSSQTAVEFSATREYPWPGWGRILQVLPPSEEESTVLDVGCGNGRFAVYLAQQWPRPFRYLGIDSSQPLIQVARTRGLDRERFCFTVFDFLHDSIADHMPYQTFSLITLFGVMHHIPGFDQRLGLLSTLLERLSSDGRLAVTFWRFGAYKRFWGKIIPWQQYNQKAAEFVDLDDLEDGDYLVSWGNPEGAIRYCHFADQKEIDTLLTLINAQCVEHFLSDGQDNRFNRYLLLKAK